MGNPFAMSFDEIKAAADANMENDKASVQPQQPAAKQQEKKSGATSFLDMVEETQRKLAEENKGTKLKKEEGSAPADNPISFDEVAGQAEKATEAAPSFDDMFAQAEGASPISFDDMFAQAQNTDASAQGAETPVQTEASAEEPAKDTSSGSAISFDELAEASRSAAVQTASETPISFDDMVAEATKAEEAPATDKPAKAEEPTKADKPVKAEEAPAKEESAKAEEAPAKEESAKAEESAKETPTTEEPTKAKPAKAKSKKAKKDDEAKEPLPDTTDEYKVDLNPSAAAGESEKPEAEKAKEPEAEKPKADKPKAKKSQAKETKTEKDQENTEDNPLSMDNLFTPDEIAGFRTIIRKFVYKEFKKAMVDAAKELLAEFDE